MFKCLARTCVVRGQNRLLSNSHLLKIRSFSLCRSKAGSIKILRLDEKIILLCQALEAVLSHFFKIWTASRVAGSTTPL